KIGEKIEVSKYGKLEAPYVVNYNHPGFRLASMAALSKKEITNVTEIAKDIAMQIAAMSPVSLDRDDCDPSIVEKEKEIAVELARNEGKPENMLEKIALGRVEKFFKESTLLNQEFIKDNKKTVKQFLTETDKDLKVTAFHRFQLSN
ncbi:MAG: translation elongation factor Ts, partial [Bacteroidota bacterium]